MKPHSRKSDNFKRYQLFWLLAASTQSGCWRRRTQSGCWRRRTQSGCWRRRTQSGCWRRRTQSGCWRRRTHKIYSHTIDCKSKNVAKISRKCK
uniref:Uncharacterized protein n=1 Tax=Oryzias latipes TaxID=8090 RepID=A0A3P9GXF5_ORYLA